MKCIDVSEFQGNIDWKKVKKDGIEGVIIRAGYGQNNIDDGFIDHIKGAIEAEMHIGIYWFSYAWNDSMAEKEAEYCIKAIMPYSDYIDMPIFFDWEYDSRRYAKTHGIDPDKGLITTMTRAFCEQIERLGFVGGYYLNLDYAQNFYNEEVLTPYKRWYARYTDIEQKNCYLWQCSDNGYVNGIKGKVDMDYLWGELVRPVHHDDTPTEELTEEPIFTIGNNYTVNVQSALNVRYGAGVGYDTVGYFNLTPDGQKHANYNGALLPETTVTCLDVEKNDDGSIWVRIPSGWVCAVNTDGTRYLV